MASDFQDFVKSLPKDAVVRALYTDSRTGQTYAFEVEASELLAGRVTARKKAGDDK